MKNKILFSKLEQFLSHCSGQWKYFKRFFNCIIQQHLVSYIQEPSKELKDEYSGDLTGAQLFSILQKHNLLEEK